MKRIASVVLAVSLLTSSVAQADGPFAGHRDHRDHRPDWRDHHTEQHFRRGHRDHDHKGGETLAAIGLGLLALGLIGALASQNDDPGYTYAPSPPPLPPPGSRHGSGRSGYPPSYGGRYGHEDVRIISCASNDYRFRYCEFPVRSRVEIVRQLSSAECRFDRSWGYDRYGIWVDEGCRAEFAVF